MDRILFLAKHKPFSDDAAQLLRLHFSDPQIVFGDSNEPFPAHLKAQQFEYVISYISPWIVPAEVLKNTTRAAINLHPGPPEYPGIGCTNFAIYEGAKEFGITVHHMKAKVDTGEIIMVERFPILDDDTVYALTQRCYEHIYHAFAELVPYMVAEKPFPISKEQWKRKPFTRKQLNELCRITKDMTDEEIQKRVCATTYPGMPGAYIELGGIKFITPAGE